LLDVRYKNQHITARCNDI